MRTQTAKRRRGSSTPARSTAKQAPLCLVIQADESDPVVLKRRLEEAVGAGRDLVIDTGAGAPLPTASVQLLLAAAACVESQGRKFRVVPDNPGIRDAFGELGLAERIASWLEPDGQGRAGGGAEV
jgi:hypothetical protein